jgi:hypothetical protein
MGYDDDLSYAPAGAITTDHQQRPVRVPCEDGCKHDDEIEHGPIGDRKGAVPWWIPCYGRRKGNRLHNRPVFVHQCRLWQHPGTPHECECGHVWGNS